MGSGWRILSAAFLICYVISFRIFAAKAVFTTSINIRWVMVYVPDSRAEAPTARVAIGFPVIVNQSLDRYYYIVVGCVSSSYSKYT
jgi:hypothetical protein